ncbi:MAG: hypothetical protein MJZ02_08415, partial [Paludibacteraceae bacterium]|nr:hypothetical protein [Paludibacteraceae bacterium]
MNIFQLAKKVAPFVKPYKWMVAGTLLMTLIGSSIAQINAIVLDWTVDQINNLVNIEKVEWGARAIEIMVFISIVLLGKEILSAIITYLQRYFGEKMRILVSKDLAQAIIVFVVTAKAAFYTA